MEKPATGNNLQETSPEKKLDFKTKLSYGIGDMGASFPANIVTFYLLFFFTNVAGIPIGMAGNILLIGKVWDGINDPMIGWLTDKTKSPRWGRRLPWLIYGAFPLGVAFFMEWLVPKFSHVHSENIWPLFFYYAVISAIFNSVFTVVNLPYIAMTPELTQDYDERTELNSFRFSFSIGGSILSLVLAQIIFSFIPAPEERYLVLAAIVGVVAIVCTLICAFGTRDRILAFEAKRTQQEEPPAIPLIEQFKIAIANRAFIIAIGIYFFSWLGLQVIPPTIPYFVRYCMKLPSDADFTQVILAVQGTALLMLFFWNIVSQRIGKKATYIIGIVPWIIACIFLGFLQPNQVWLMYVLAVVAGCGVSIAYLIPASMLPDVIDLDELISGQRREGIFYGFMVFIQKFGTAFGLFILGHFLQSAGFKETIPGQSIPPVQPESALLAIRIALAAIPSVCLIIGIILTCYYPITREVHDDIKYKLLERQAARRN